MGLLDMMGVGQSPIGQFVNNNRYALSAFGAGLAGGRNLGEALAMGARNIPQARMMDDQRGQQAEDERNRQERLNQTMNWLRNQAAEDPYYGDLLSAVESRGVSPAQAWEMAMSRAYPGRAKPPASYQEYNLAKDDPAYARHLRDQAQYEGGISGQGPVASGYERIWNPQERRYEDRLIHGTPQWQDVQRQAAEAQSQAQAQTEGSVAKAATMLDATRTIKEIAGSTQQPVAGTLSRPFAQLTDTPAGRVRAQVNALKSGVALQAMMRLKEASATGATGFGQMNRAELQILIDEMGALDPDITDQETFLKTIDRIEARFQRVIENVARTVPRDNLAEWGLLEMVDMAMGGAASATDPLGIR